MSTARQIILATVLIAAAPICAAVGLGSIDGTARLGAPLALEIPLEGARLNAADLRVDVPGHAEHSRLGATDPVIPEGLNARISSAGGGHAVIQLETERRVMEPVLRFMVRVQWPGGTQVREYQVLLDPPTYVARAAAPTPAAVEQPTRPTVPLPPIVEQALPAQAAKPTSARPGERYGPVAFGDTLGAIVQRAYAGSGHDTARIASRTVADNPGAFLNGDGDQLQQGAWLSLPSLAALADTATPVAATTSPPRSATNSTAAGRYAVRNGDTLYSISRHVTGAPETEIGSIAKRIYAMNPHAFIDGDINRLKAGSVLALDDGATPIATAALATESSAARASTQRGATATQTPGDLTTDSSMPTAQQVAAVRQVLADERARTVELQARLDRAMAQLAALEVRAQSLNDEIERKSNELSQRVASLLEADPKPAVVERSAASTEAVSAPKPARSTLVPVTAAAAATGDVTQVASEGFAASALVEQVLNGQTPALAILALIAALMTAVAFIVLRKRPKSARHHSAEDEDAERVEEIRTRLSNDDDLTLFETQDDLNIEIHHEPDPEEHTRVVPASPELADESEDNVVLTDSARASKLAKQAAVSMAYEDYAGSKLYIEEAIRLEPHRDEHKMVLLTLHQCLGNHADADALIDDLLARREQLSGELRAHVEQLSQRRHG